MKKYEPPSPHQEASLISEFFYIETLFYTLKTLLKENTSIENAFLVVGPLVGGGGGVGGKPPEPQKNFLPIF